VSGDLAGLVAVGGIARGVPAGETALFQPAVAAVPGWAVTVVRHSIGWSDRAG